MAKVSQWPNNSYYDPTPWYLKYDNVPDSIYKSYFYFDKTMNSFGLPVPNIGEISHIVYLEYWSAIFESPMIKAALLFFVSNSVFSLLIGIFFFLSYLKGEGFEGFEWNLMDKNKDETVSAMTW